MRYRNIVLAIIAISSIVASSCLEPLYVDPDSGHDNPNLHGWNITASNNITAFNNLTVGNRLYLSRDPLAAYEAATKNYVDAHAGGGGGGGIAGSGTANKVAKWTGAASIGNSGITDTGNLVTISENITTPGQIRSTLPNGTAPFSVTSGTWVENLNVDQVDSIEGADLLKKDGTVAMTGELRTPSENITTNLKVGGNITVGGTVDGVDVSSHNARHKWLGADEVNIKDLEMGSFPFFLSGHGAGGQWTEILTAGRGWTDVSYTAMAASSGNVNGDVSGRVCGTNVYFDKDTAGDRVRFTFRFQPATTTNQSEMWVGYFNDATTFPTTTSRHVGIRVLENAGAGDYKATVYASNGTGAAGTQTSIDTTTGSWTTLDIYIKYMATDIKYYMSKDGAAISLVATHTTNMPDDHGQFLGIWSKTTENVVKTAYIYVPRTLKGAE